MDRINTQESSGRELLGIRLGIALLSTSIVVGGRLGGGFRHVVDYLAVAIPLIPTLIYAVGATTHRAVTKYGLTIVGLNAAAWIPFALSGEPFWLLTLFPVFIASLILAILAVVDKGPER